MSGGRNTPRLEALDAGARRQLGAFVEAVDALAPGRLEGLYLYGSAALGDYRRGQSDLDVVAVSTSPWTSDVLDGLAAVHARLAGDPTLPALDALYATWAELCADPAAAVAPGALGGVLQARGAFDANWAVWETLRRHPLRLRGPGRPAVAQDADGLRAFCLANLQTYWLPLASRAEAALEARPEAGAATLSWCVPGVLRLAYTIGLGDIASKSAALGWGLEHADKRWRPLLRRALALRQGGDDPDPGGAGAIGPDGVGAFMRHVVDTARTTAVACARPAGRR